MFPKKNEENKYNSPSKNYQFTICLALLPQLFVLKTPQYKKYSGISKVKLGQNLLPKSSKSSF